MILQPQIHSALIDQARMAYRRLIKTAYMLAVDGLPLTSFRTMVNIQRANGVQLISKTDSNDKAREFVQVIAESVREKHVEIMSSVAAFSLLSDGSQARKTGSEKELVFARVVKDGVTVNLCVALQNIDVFGDANADNLKACIDKVFKDEGHIQISDEKYNKLLVSVTADGASVNTGVYNGLLTQMKNDNRPWLLTTHCISHRVELAVKTSMGASFQEIKDCMTTLYYLFKRSGKFKRHFVATANALDVHHFNFPKVHGTRFVNHVRGGLNHLLNNWVVLAQAIENSLASTKDRSVSAKLRGILKKLKDFTFLAKCTLYKELLNAISVLSLQFEKHEIYAYEVLPSIEKTKDALNDLFAEASGTNCQNLVGKLNIVLNTVTNHVEFHVLKACQNKRKLESREYNTLTYVMNNIANSESVVEKVKQSLIPKIKDCLDSRFKSFESECYKNMLWIDPANWGDTACEIDSMRALANHFSETLAVNNFDISKLSSEWKDFKRMVNYFMKGMKAKQLWERVLVYRRKQFKNICLLAEIVMCTGISNSVVEAGFSHLTCILSDRRLSMKHQTMENLLLIKVNDSLWSNKEREELLESALVKYYNMAKRRKRKLENVESFSETVEISTKKLRHSGVSGDEVTDNSDVEPVIELYDSDNDSCESEEDSDILDDIFLGGRETDQDI